MKTLKDYMKNFKKINEAGLDLDKGQKRWEDYDTIVCPDGYVLDMKKLLQKQDSIRTAAIHIYPEFQGFLSVLNFKYTFQVDTQATDGFSIYVNPEFTDRELNDDTKKFAVLMHEVMHCVLNHLRRGKDHDPNKSNVAADYEVNSTLVELTNQKGHSIVSPQTWKSIHALYDEKYKGLGYETIYGMVNKDNSSSMDNKEGAKEAQNNNPKSSKGPRSSSNSQSGNSQQGSQSGDQSGSSGGSQNKQSNSGFREGQTSRDDPEAKPGQNQGRVRPEDCTCGATPDLSKVPGNAGGMISKEDGDKISESEGYNKDEGSENGQASYFEEEAQRLADKMSRKPGVDQGWLDFCAKISGLNKVTTNWRQALKNVVGRAINKRDTVQAYANKNVLASRDELARTAKNKHDAVSNIVAFVDTSGSMSNEYKAACLKQVYQTAKQIKATSKILIVPFDDGPRDVLEYNDYNKLYKDLKNGKCTLKGGGGTNVIPCFKMLDDDKRFKHRKFELIMIFTDGYLNQVPRPKKKCGTLCWVIADDPTWKLEYPDAHTKVIYMDKRDFEQ